MESINIHEAKTHLSRLVERAALGESFVIAKAAGRVRRLGFMNGRITVPDDFDRMGSSEIEQLFGGNAFEQSIGIVPKAPEKRL